MKGLKMLGAGYWACPVKCDEGAYFTGVLGEKELRLGKGETWGNMKACHVKCDACPVKFEVRKYFTREGAYFTVDE